MKEKIEQSSLVKLRLEVAATFTMRHPYQISHVYYAKRRKKEHLSDSESRDIAEVKTATVNMG